MLTGQGIAEIDGREVYYARYLDWVVTTPLLLTALYWTAHYRVEHKRYTTLAVLVGAQVVMILTALIADLSGSFTLSTVWFLIGCATLLVVFWVFWVPLRATAEAQGEDLARVYKIAAAYLTVQWCLYPIILYAGPSYLHLFGKPVETWLLVIVPFFSKVGFSFLDLSLLRRLPREPRVAMIREGGVAVPV